MYKRAVDNIPYTGDTIRQFGGFNNTDMIQENEFEDMMNMSSDRYPYICTRAHRQESNSYVYPEGIAETKWVYALPAGPSLAESYKNGLLLGVRTNIPGNDSTLYDDIAQTLVKPPYPRPPINVDNLPGKVATVGANIVFWDAKEIYNTDNHTWTKMEERISRSLVRFQFLPQSNLYVDIEVVVQSESKPDWEFAPGIWYEVTGLEIDELGNTPPENKRRFVIDEVKKKWTSGSNNTWIYAGRMNWAATTNPETYLASKNQNMCVRVEAPYPDLSGICSSNNRLWGWAGKELYASKLGDPAEFWAYEGISTDSYAVTAGDCGKIKACIGYRNTVLFFTATTIIRVSGTQPSNFSVQEIHCNGLDGDSRSIAILHDKLYYKSFDAIMMYDGYTPIEISSPIDGVQYDAAYLGTHGEKLFAFLTPRGSNNMILFSYDTKRNIWEKEEEFTKDNVKSMATSERTLFVSIHDEYQDRDVLWSPSSRNCTDEYSLPPEGAFDWYVQTGDLLLYSLDRKYLQKVKVRIELAVGATAEIYASIDGSEFKQIGRMAKPGQHTYLFPVTMSQCDSLKLKISGHGDATIMGIQKIWGEGNDI